LGNSDEGILRGQGGEKKSLTPHISPVRGDGGTEIFSSIVRYGALMLVKFQPPILNRA